MRTNRAAPAVVPGGAPGMSGPPLNYWASTPSVSVSAAELTMSQSQTRPRSPLRGLEVTSCLTQPAMIYSTPGMQLISQNVVKNLKEFELAWAPFPSPAAGAQTPVQTCRRAARQGRAVSSPRPPPGGLGHVLSQFRNTLSQMQTNGCHKSFKG